ncbi:MAG: hypothetical protein ACFB2X_26930 [Rivularia sp. (in: cyanobacteria)]
MIRNWEWKIEHWALGAQGTGNYKHQPRDFHIATSKQPDGWIMATYHFHKRSNIS